MKQKNKEGRQTISRTHGVCVSYKTLTTRWVPKVSLSLSTYSTRSRGFYMYRKESSRPPPLLPIVVVVVVRERRHQSWRMAYYYSSRQTTHLTRRCTTYLTWGRRQYIPTTTLGSPYIEALFVCAS